MKSKKREGGRKGERRKGYLIANCKLCTMLYTFKISHMCGILLLKYSPERRKIKKENMGGEERQKREGESRGRGGGGRKGKTKREKGEY